MRLVFQRARNSAPCVIFFDELDALCPKRSEHAEVKSSLDMHNPPYIVVLMFSVCAYSCEHVCTFILCTE